MNSHTQILPGFKSSPIGPIPNDWEVIELGELFDFKNGINAEKESYGSGVKFINVMEVINNDWITSDNIPGYISISEDQKELYLVKDGDVLFNRTSETTEEVGLTAVFNGSDEVVFGGFVIRARPINYKINNNFKRYCFRSKLIRYQIIRNGQGVIRSNIGQADLKKIIILLPPILEQTAIASLLNIWDNSIAKTTALISQKELRKKWLLQQLLSGKKRLKGFVCEWMEVHLGEMLSERNETHFFDLPLLSVGANGIYPQSDSIKRDISNNDKSKYKRICPGDIGYNTMRMWQGRSALSNLEGIVSPVRSDFPVSQRTYKFRLYFTDEDENWYFQEYEGHTGVVIPSYYKPVEASQTEMEAFIEQNK